MRRSLSYDSGKFALPYIFGNDPDVSATGKHTFNPKEQRDRKKLLRQGSLNQGLVPRDKKLAKVNETVDIPKLTLPAIPVRTGLVNNEEKRQRRRMHCCDFSLQAEPGNPQKNKSRRRTSESSTSDSQGVDISPAERRLPFVIYDKNYLESRKEVEPGLKNSRTFLPLLGSILEVQRMNLREKDNLNNQRKQFYKPTGKGRRKRHEGQPLMWFF